MVPCNRVGYVVAYMYLCLVELFGGEFTLFFSVMGYDR